ncbi:angiogenic factor with G patch and FHA domains 1-like isoform X2 [Battus philenor]|uniref:angiogenic factor with G patch and FHA domains 1-like isoform X2 n=1 Tax=Battus philenor TaxID=42288 RepID=UPI0035D0D7DB
MSAVLNNHNVETKVHKKNIDTFKLRPSLQLCLKYRPEIYKLILNMHKCIRRKNTILTRLKKKLKLLSTKKVFSSEKLSAVKLDGDVPKKKIEASTQTDQVPPHDSNTTQQTTTSKENEDILRDSAWSVHKEEGDQEKSIADQVKEVAQSALEESGMVYVASAGMYYDYKTGYYYNSELGLYYHTDTGCYYYYSNEKKNFVFHSYPDRSAEIANASLIKHSIKKAKKHKKEMKTNIDNLTKNFSQEKEESTSEEHSKAKKKKSSRRNIKKNNMKKLTKNAEHNNVNPKNDDIETNEIKDLNKEVSIEKATVEMNSEVDELEEGECSETDCEEIMSEDDEDIESIASTSTATDDDEVAKQHPPCIRLIVRETNLQKLKVGSLFVITKDGGSIGREGDQHAVVIRDSNVSRNHLDIRYNSERDVYLATDLGSKNGTILNGTRMSECQDISVPMEVVHGSVIQMGETKLLCHIHPGNETCGHCEPGLLMETEEKERKVAYTRTCSVQRQYQLELARLKNKYAKPPLAIEAEAYNDRAQARRDTVGSSHHAEKTQSSDVDSFITPENKGFKLLEKMGWSKGEGLGKDNQGDKEPIPLISNDGKAGLGSASSVAATPSYLAPTSTLGPATLRLAARTKMLQPPAKAFQNPLNYDSE